MDHPIVQDRTERAGTRRPLHEYRTVESCEVEIPHPAGLIIFGASGDLTRRKLFPSLYRLYRNRMLAQNFFILGTSRITFKDEQFRAAMHDTVKEALPGDFDEGLWGEFEGHIYYSTFEYGDLASYTADLAEILPRLEARHQTEGNRVFYLAIPPFVFEQVIHNLGRAGLARKENGWSHIVIEKPFGHDLASARRLNNLVHEYYEEDQIFRIDHYLAKETVQNVLMFRFANSIFEPLWNRHYTDHVQITSAETIGVEHRAGYYEPAGVIRDMFQNHMFQLLCLTAMDPPAQFIADRVQDDKAKTLRSLKPVSADNFGDAVVVGQYGPGIVNGQPVPGYREEPGVAEGSKTATYAALKVFIDSWRWQGVPFYLRSGKRLASRKTEISIHFKEVPYSMFPDSVSQPVQPNTIVLKIQPDEGMELSFQTKQPGTKVCLKTAQMTYSYPRGVLLDAYEWVLLDCMLGDHMLFMREDSVELAWSSLTPVLDAIESNRVPLSRYPAGSDGPEDARLLMERDRRAWRPL